MSNEFQFDGLPDFDEREPIFVSVIADQGMGKTHLLNTFPNPTVCDTEGRAHIVMRKFNNKKRKVIETFDDIRQTVLYALDHDKPGSTIGVDSASDLRSLAEIEYLKETGKEKVYPEVCWAQVDIKPKNMLKLLRSEGWNVVLTQRTRDVYKDGEITGESQAEGWKRIQFLCDLTLWLQKGLVYNGKLYGDDIVIARVLDNKWHPKGAGKPYLIDVSYDGIFNELKPEWNGTMEDIIKEIQAKSNKEPIDISQEG